MSLQFSPSKFPRTTTTSSPRRVKRPSPEKRCLPLTATLVVLPKRVASTSGTGSPSKKLKESELKSESQSEYQSTELSLGGGLAQSKKIELPYSLVLNGKLDFPSKEKLDDLLRIFPTTFAVEVCPPFLIIRVRDLPPKPWPLLVGGVPSDFRTDEHGESFTRGKMGRGRKYLEKFDLHKKTELNDSILKLAVQLFKDLNIRIRDIYWYGGFWQVTVSDGTDIKKLPNLIASSPAFYRTLSEAPDPDPAALRSKPPQGIEYDDTTYSTTPNSLLRPGIMLSSSLRVKTVNGKTEEGWNSTTSGVMVADLNGQIFITVASHGFENDGLVYHPDPKKGTVIGNIVESLPHTDISLVRLKPGLRYVNETFGSSDEPGGIHITGISPLYAPHFRAFDSLSMDNPFSGGCEGTALAVGGRVAEHGKKEFVKHTWSYFENGDQPIQGSCGSPVVDENGCLVGLFRYQVEGSSMCLCVAGTELREHGYELCGGEQTFA